MSDSMSIQGVVLCSCGGQIISNTGKVLMNYGRRKLHCWDCDKVYDMDYAYSMRKENETVTLERIK